jgi:hypothetical protein
VTAASEAQGGPDRCAGRRTRLAPPAALGAVLAGASLLVARVDPSHPGHYPVCPLYALTGLYCPLCGCLRATHAMTRLDLGAAAGYNPVWLVVAPVLVVAWGAWLVRSWRGTSPRPVPAWAWWTVGALLVAFTVLRNVPGLAPWLAP